MASTRCRAGCVRGWRASRVGCMAVRIAERPFRSRSGPIYLWGDSQAHNRKRTSYAWSVDATLHMTGPRCASPGIGLPGPAGGWSAAGGQGSTGRAKQAGGCSDGYARVRPRACFREGAGFPGAASDRFRWRCPISRFAGRRSGSRIIPALSERRPPGVARNRARSEGPLYFRFERAGF